MVLKERYQKRMVITEKIMLLPNAVSLSRNTEWREEWRKNLILSRVNLKLYMIGNKRILKTSIEQKMTNLKVGKDPTDTQLVFEQTRKV